MNVDSSYGPVSDMPVIIRLAFALLTFDKPSPRRIQRWVVNII
ncbi:hypothetical protein QWZ16_07150 [Vibrio ostreicida]|uniref:Uncharacterized protein n=1 Tax=Vibrio ostreicida TaxID=526588 RepID=A0ABT8BSX7_9VIBR|nr:hypothetical protein [Vibrio ostreicida]MDN3609479.1 hypothetical protein [Vibrio ostreicida]